MRFIALLIAFGCQAFAAAEATGRYRIEFEAAHPLPEVRFEGKASTIHVQGLFVTKRHYLVTGRWETPPKKALLLRFDREDPGRYDVVDITPPQRDGETLDHPGGFDIDRMGNFWIPVSTSHREGPTLICRYKIEPDRALPSKPQFAFPVRDHVGAICALPNDSLLGANWDTLTTYAWSPQGQLLSTWHESALFPESRKWNLAVQDWKYLEGTARTVVAGGLDKSQSPPAAVVQVVDLNNLVRRQVHSIPAPAGVARPVTNEGLAVHDGNLFLLPEDIGRGARILRYTFDSGK